MKLCINCGRQLPNAAKFRVCKLCNNTPTCLQCGAPLQDRQRSFCSLSCSATHQHDFMRRVKERDALVLKSGKKRVVVERCRCEGKVDYLTMPLEGGCPNA